MRCQYQPTRQDGPRRAVQIAPQIQEAVRARSRPCGHRDANRRRGPQLPGRRRSLLPTSRPEDRCVRRVYRHRHGRHRPQAALTHHGTVGRRPARRPGRGANELIDYTKADFADLLAGYDVVLDSLGGGNLAKSLTVLKPGGLAISVVGPPDPAFAEQVGRPLLKPVMALMSHKVRAGAHKLGVRYSFFFMRANGEQLTTLAALYDAGTLRPVLDRTYPFTETLQAMAYVEQGRAKGKIVVIMPSPVV